ncbi:hypothetical protein M433DRAFT_96734 [Acidomyces richmondensis BFW]|nr:hypothetical protein M433DRAFT_96734 [Acidomyces richmondensis BFW]
MARLFPRLTATTLQATTYLLGVALFSIAFLVFLNSSISFVVTDVIGQKEDVGSAVGTLGFADELLALVACPLWGLLSDRIGVRAVAVSGYCIIAFSLVCLVQSENVYPELLVGRLGFSLGAAACSTMVTAVLPAMFAKRTEGEETDPAVHEIANGHAARLPSQLAGLVGLFTGAGALVALLIFLPLPTWFQGEGQSRAHSVQSGFYIVASVAVCVAIFIFFGLRNLPGEEDKTLSALWSTPYDESTKTTDDGHLHTTLTPAPSYMSLVKESLKLGFTNPSIGLGYLGGFVARASSVGISLFIPLFVNAYFVRNGLCTSNPDDLTDIKENCKRAYTLSAALTGVAETAALICAPLFGFVGGKVMKGRSEWPLLFAAAVGVGGYIAFGFLRNPDAFHGDGGQWAFVAVVLIGISQIGAIVCSLGLLSRGINQNSDEHGEEEHPRPPTASTLRPDATAGSGGDETTPLLPQMGAKGAGSTHQGRRDQSHLKGSIAGVYSFAGGAGILLLTKLGGALFDSWTSGAPFFLLAIFNGILLIAIAVVCGLVKVTERNQRSTGPFQAGAIPNTQ